MTLRNHSLILLTAMLIAVGSLNPLAAADKFTLEQVVAKHLETVLGQKNLQALTTPRLISGISAMKILDGGTGLVKGNAEFRSTPESLVLQLKFESQGYPQDGFRMRADGTVLPIEVSPGTSGFLAGFMDGYRHVARSGLFGSVLSAGWTFARPESARGKMSYKGVKKVDGRKLHLIEVEFEAGMKSDVYFDEESFIHVRTVHRIPPDRGNAYLTEEFEDFVQVSGLVFPKLWRMTVEWRGNRRILYEVGLQNLQSNPGDGN